MENTDKKSAEVSNENLEESLLDQLNKLLEGDAAEAEITMAARGIVDELQDVIEKLGKIQIYEQIKMLNIFLSDDRQLSSPTSVLGFSSKIAIRRARWQRKLAHQNVTIQILVVVEQRRSACTMMSSPMTHRQQRYERRLASSLAWKCQQPRPMSSACRLPVQH